MALLSFKDVGIQAVSRPAVNQLTRNPSPIGIKTPLEIDQEGNNLFTMHYTLKNQIADNLRNLVLTNHGERLALYDFGANIRPLLTEWSNKEDFDKEVMLRINTAISKYMSFVTPLGYESKPDYLDNIFTGIVKIVLLYSVPSLNLREELLELTLFVI
ncbi:MAG: hypothetical protein WC761_00645 [Candidatus Paceibacterota bacterium]|jgi:hypothetical protein